MSEPQFDLTVLDFDKPRICSTTQSVLSLVSCLQCGSFLSHSSMSTDSQALLHALSNDHEFFIDLNSGKSFSIVNPDEEISSPFLSHLKHFLTFSCFPKYLSLLDDSNFDLISNLFPALSLLSNSKIFRFKSLSESSYFPGFVPLISSSSLFSLTTCFLFRLVPFRNALLSSKVTPDSSPTCSNLITLSSFYCNLFYSPYLIRPQISIDNLHRLFKQKFQYLMKRSTEYSQESLKDPFIFLSLFISFLNKDSPKSISSWINSFMFEIKIQNIISKSESIKNDWILTITPPPLSLFKDVHEENQIPSVSIYDLLSVFNGETVVVDEDDNKIIQKLTDLPEFLLIYINRFEKEALGMKKNITMVDIPLSSMDLSFLIGCSKVMKYRAKMILSHVGTSNSTKFILFIELKSNWYCIDGTSVSQVAETQVASSDYIWVYFELLSS
ncbi:hypothetical protein RCL1_005904 [Eukaryota sp. TZLM3-RCL]